MLAGSLVQLAWRPAQAQVFRVASITKAIVGLGAMRAAHGIIGLRTWAW